MGPTLALAVVLVALGVWAGVQRHLGPARGAGPTDARQSSVNWESMTGLAWMDEQSAAETYADSLRRHNVDRFGIQSPPAWWLSVWRAWLRQQLGDYLTAEQVGGAAAAQLASLLGVAHPMAEAAAVVHLSTLQERGAWGDAGRLAGTLWRAHLATIDADEAARALPSLDDATLRSARASDDADGDGLADLVERFLGTSTSLPARPGELVFGQPARGYALPLSPSHVAAHVRGIPLPHEGFGSASTSPMERIWLHPLTSVQRAFAGRYGWLLRVVADGDGCAVALDAGAPPRRLDVRVTRRGTSWQVESNGSVTDLSAPVETLQIVADYDAESGTVFWWSSSGQSWTTNGAAQPTSGSAPYGLRVTEQPSGSSCRSVTWTLRHASVAPM